MINCCLAAMLRPGKNQSEINQVLHHLPLMYWHQSQHPSILSAKSICNNVALPGVVMQGEIIITKILQPTPLPQVQVPLGKDVGQALVVRKHVEGLTIQVVTPGLQGEDDCGKLQVMNGIVALVVLQLSRTKSNNSAQLLEYTAKSQ